MCKKELRMLSTKCLEIYKQDLALINLQWLLCHETQPNQDLRDLRRLAVTQLLVYKNHQLELVWKKAQRIMIIIMMMLMIMIIKANRYLLFFYLRNQIFSCVINGKLMNLLIKATAIIWLLSSVLKLTLLCSLTISLINWIKTCNFITV